MAASGPVLIPLDGSELAEGALPYALALARATESSIVLLTVSEKVPELVDLDLRALAADAEERARAHWTAYLQRLHRQIGDAIPTNVQVREGDAPDEILKAVEALGARYLVMSTHGRAGISRWRYGSTAGQLLHASPVPMLVVGPRVLERHQTEVTFKHIMVPLDGGPLSEVAIPVARELAEALGARVSLVEVVGWAVQTYPYALPDAYLPQLDQDWEAAATEYPVPCDWFHRDRPNQLRHLGGDLVRAETQVTVATTTQSWSTFHGCRRKGVTSAWPSARTRTRAAFRWCS